MNLNVMPGWNDEVKPFKEKAMFWVSAGKPINNVLHRIMQRTRKLYHCHYYDYDYDYVL